jgi:hypothetical protein
MFEDTDEPPKPVRGERGRWKKGTKSPNPGGYSKADRVARKDVKEAARKFTPQVLKMLMNNANRHAFAHERHTEHSAESANPLGFDQGVFWLGQNIGHLDGSTFEHRTPVH